MKICTKCKESKSLKFFSKRPASKDGLNMWCKACVKINNDKYRRLNIEKIRVANTKYQREHPDKVQNKELKYKFGITKIIYDKMLDEQVGICALCFKSESAKNREGKIRRLSVDHNHITNQVRSLLCTRCNKGLGIFDDNASLLRRAADYLDNWRLK